VLTAAIVFPKGDPDIGDGKDTQFHEWSMMVTALDTSGLSLSRQIMGTIILRSLTQTLHGTDYRIRSFDEMEYYREIASSRAQNEIARSLATKQNERDLLFFRGDPEWRYARNLKNIENDLLKLEENFLAAQAVMPYITPLPPIKIRNDANSDWPAAPDSGGEYKFCTDKKLDGFLTGSLTEYYGRIYLVLRLYTLYTRSYSWESAILFSSEELTNAVSEISGRLVAAVTGIEPAGLFVRAGPPEAMILIDDNWAGRGEVPLREHTPGEITITSYADRYVSASYPLEILPGEITELYFNLTPLSLVSFTVDAPDNPDSSVFLGSLYVGKTPLYMELPKDQISFISVETAEGETGTAVYRANAVRGSAEFIPGDALFIKTGIPVSPEEKRVSKARNNFYSAYGRLWIALPASLLTMGIVDNYINAYNYSPTMEMYNAAKASSWIKIGAYVVIGLAATETVYRIVRYLMTSGANADPIARFKPNTETSQ